LAGITEKVKNNQALLSRMKTIFIEAKHPAKVELPPALIRELPGRIMLFTTVQFVENAGSWKKALEKEGKKAILIKPEHAKHEGQLLGCSIKRFKQDFDAFLYVGDGLFHPKALMLKNEKPVFAYDPFSKKFAKIDEKDVERMQRRMMGALTKFIASKEIGVLVSTKPGQNRLKQAQELEKRYPGKSFYIMLSNTIDFSELENYPFIECFVNTACPRIAYDDSEKVRKPVLNIEDLELLDVHNS
jgi:2-(3-amino-3-carboxypropyl)histidine synthase